ncbi:MAG: ATP-dependent Clp protease adaptor ClpS [Spirochaetia bacterium]|nr:ATP-dependent Clp protease adaptor ClpS [Spirochaetia bacterium]
MIVPSFEIHTDSEVDVEIELKEPSRYVVILHNDDYTSMEFVVMILRVVFGKSSDEAISIMYDVHRKGNGIAGIYTKEIAETRVQLVHSKARENGFPLRCTMERES